MKKHLNEQKYTDALQGKEIPILTLDSKWHLLFGESGPPADIQEIADQLNELISRQATLREKEKEIKKLKKKLLDEIMQIRYRLMAEPDNAQIEQLLDKHTGLIEECNQKIDALEEEQISIPQDIYDINFQLMLETMSFCYEYMRNNTEEIKIANAWIKEVRVELKKRLVRKQEGEIDNYNIYTYMHKIFGPEVIDLFDMQYDPETVHPRVSLMSDTTPS